MNYSVKVNGKAIDIYEEKVFPAPYNEVKAMECAMFFQDGAAELEIESKIKVKSVIVRPISSGVKAELCGRVIKMKIEHPCKLSVEINGSYENNLAVFAERQRECPKGDVIRVSGRVTQEIFDVSRDNCTIFFDTDAVLEGKLLVHDCENVTICGYGKISMANTDWNIRPVEKRRALEVIGCKNVTVRDLRISDSVDWSLRVMGCDNVTVDNIKIIGCRGNSDGVDICGSRNVTVKNIFTRTWDDSFVLKALDTGDAENVTFCDSVLWNDFARSLEVGGELRADNVRNITFRNVDIIHSPTGYPIMGVHHGDRARVRDIAFEDIRIEDTPGAQLFDIRIAKTVWNRDAGMGDVDGVRFKNISYIGKPGMQYALSKSRIEGFSDENSVRNVTIENFSILGKTAGNAAECGVNVMDYAENVRFVCPKEADRINPVIASVSKEDFTLGADGRYHGRLSVELHNAGEKTAAGNMWLQISPVNTAVYDGSVYGYELAPGESSKRSYDVTLPAGKYYFCVQSDGADLQSNWIYTELELVINKAVDIENAPVMAFHNYYGNEAQIQLAIRGDELIIKSPVLQDTGNRLIVYTAMPVADIDGQVKFSVEETDFGEAPAVLLSKHGYELAPQLRCPAEITYVFKNEPKVKKIFRNEICTDRGEASIPFEKLGVSGSNFWLEIAADIPEVRNLRYPLTLFHSVKPEDTAHMFANVIAE